MNQAPHFWAAKLTTRDQLITFWNLIREWGFSGETAYCRAIDGEKPSRKP